MISYHNRMSPLTIYLNALLNWSFDVVLQSEICVHFQISLTELVSFWNVCMGVARIFQRGGHTDSYRGYSSDCHLNIVSCLLTRRLTKGGGGSRAPQDPPWLRLWFVTFL